MSAEAGRVFISYVREDAERVGQLKRWLEAAGVRVWLDKDDLWPGENWRLRIRQAIQRDALVFIACFSQRSLARSQSYQYEELTLALGQMRQRRPGEPWLIPVRFDECEIPALDIGVGHTLADLECVDFFGGRRDEAAARLITTLLRIRGDVAGPVSFPVTGRRHVIGALARSLVEGSATRVQVLEFFGRPALEVDGFWQGITDWERDNVLALLLADLDEKAADALCAHWDVVAADTARYLGRLLDDGEAEAATWCLGTVGTAPIADAEDHLLSGLLMPGTGTSGHRPARIPALVHLLRQRLVPRPGTFRRSCAALRSGGDPAWQIALVRALLARETEAARAPRAADWVNWLCLTESPEHEQPPEWVTALAAASAGSFGWESDAGIQSLVRSDIEWVIVISRLARHGGHHPVMRKISRRDLKDIAARLAVSPLPDERDWSGALLAQIDTGPQDEWSPETAAVMDVIRVMLGDQPREFPADRNHEFVTRYVSTLGRVLRGEALASARPRVQREFLTHAGRGDVLPRSAAYLLSAWATDPVMVPAVVGLLDVMPAAKLLASPLLGAEFWHAMASHEPALERNAYVSLLKEAVTEVARDPGGVTKTRLASAIYRATKAGLSLKEVMSVLFMQDEIQLAPDVLNDVLNEFEHMLSLDCGLETAENSAGIGIREFYRQVAHGAMGEEYKEHLSQYLAGQWAEAHGLGDVWSREPPRPGRRKGR